MLRKRRVTVHHVDSSHYGGPAQRSILSFLNGSRHLIRDPGWSSEDDPQPLPSRVLVHSFTGTVTVDAVLSSEKEQVVEIAVNEAGIVACRVLVSGCPSLASPDRQRCTKVVFLSGCQRMAEMEFVQRGDESLSGSGDSLSSLRRTPIQCFRVEAPVHASTVSMDVAVFQLSRSTICACTPQVGKQQDIDFKEEVILCMSAGRPGRAEVTVLLSNNSVVLCGTQSPSQSSSLNYGMTADAATAIPGTRSISADATLSQSSFAIADELSRFGQLCVMQLSGATASLKHGVAPLRMCWTGETVLWIIYDDGAVISVECIRPTEHDMRATANEEAEVSTVAPVLQIARVQEGNIALTSSRAGVAEPLLMTALQVSPEQRSSTVHFAFTAASGGGTASVSPSPVSTPMQLYYGSMHLSPCCEAEGTEKVSLQWRRQCVLYSETLYGVRFDRGQYHVLSQSVESGSPLFVSSLPRDSPMIQSTEHDTSYLAHQIMQSKESALAEYCRQCDALLDDLQSTSATLRSVEEAAAHMSKLTHLHHAIYALLCRQQESLTVGKLDPSESHPYRLLRRATRCFVAMSVYVLYMRLGIFSVVAQPLCEVLRLREARRVAREAQMELSALMRDTFSLSSFHGTVMDVSMWHQPTPLCIDVLLQRLGIAAEDHTVSLMSLLSDVDSVSPTLVLLILYCSYQNIETEAGMGMDMQRQNAQWRESLLLVLKHSVHLNAWAFVCYAVDHSINPASQCEEVENNSSAAGSLYRYFLGPSAHHLGAVPLHDLLSPVIIGLSHVAAFDAVLHLTSTCLAAYPKDGDEMPIPLAMRLLCVAVHSGATQLIETLYGSLRLSPTLRLIGAQPLTYAALRQAEVSVLRGWVEVGGDAASIIEHTLQASTGPISKRERLLLLFYILQRRYEDALQTCSAAAAAETDPVQAQRLQVVMSYLRSLLSAYAEVRSSTPAAALPLVQVSLPMDGSVQRPWLMRTIAATVLENSPCETAAQYLCVSNRQATTAGRAGIPAARIGTHAASSSRNQNSTGTPPLAQSMPQSSSAEGQIETPSYQPDEEAPEEATVSPLPRHASAVAARGKGQSSASVRAGTSPGRPQFASAKCEAIIQRSGAVCSRPIPCPYHSR